MTDGTSYRHDVKEYADACLEGLKETLEAPRATALHVRDIEQIIGQLRKLSTHADLALIEARQDDRKA